MVTKLVNKAAGSIFIAKYILQASILQNTLRTQKIGSNEPFSFLLFDL
jgi:hypothetical protein